ncbi:MAG TPA: FAD-dependent oxidoreductase [Bryobacteraceae bacterium]|nr:FAD-dependent oxidoreductase [Bryobacteraceae bacterium]
MTHIIDRRTFVAGAGAALSALQALAAGREIDCDVAVIGGGVGGFAAALAALRNGMRVVLTEETDWIGGQLTAQAVPPDEHPWIEEFGCTASYRAYRNAVRAYYRAHYPLTSEARRRVDLNPGNGSVSRLTHEFKVSVAVLEAMLAPYAGNGQLTLLREHTPVSATIANDRVTSATVRDLRRGLERAITARYYLDATELGDLLPLANVEHVTGAESQKETGEMHAAAERQPGNSQSFTFCFAMDYRPAEDHTIERPERYNEWKDYVPKLTPPWTGRLFSWTACEPRTLGPRDSYFDPQPTDDSRSGLNLWIYRRIADRANFTPGAYASSITLVNWPQNDYWLGDLVTASRVERPKLLERAKQLSFSFLYWMQTVAGWKGLRLRQDIVDTDDGMAKAAYIRESRRVLAEFTVLEEHVGAAMRMKVTGKSGTDLQAAVFPDSVGVGCYRIDLHPSAGGTNYIDVGSLPFQIPLGALIPRRIENLLPACKNIGTTHITNGCYRLHPVEWNIGEAAGALAAHAVATRQSPRAVRNTARLLADFTARLQAQGFELEWPRIHPV